MLELLHQVRWQDALDIGIITFLVYRALQIVRGSRAMQMIIGLAVILVAYVSSRILGLFTLNWILDNFLSSIILVIIVIFQSDIRRALTQVGTAPLFSTLERSEQRREDVVEEVAQAVMSLAGKRVGALIVFQRDVGLSEFMEIGTRLDAWVSRELLESVFLPHSPIHDGALVIQKGRVTAVRCLLPLSTNPHLRKTWGTRHHIFSLPGAADRARQPGHADDHRLGGYFGRLRFFPHSRSFHSQLDSRQLFEFDHFGDHRDLSERYPARAYAGRYRAVILDAGAIRTAPRGCCRRSRSSGDVARR